MGSGLPMGASLYPNRRDIKRFTALAPQPGHRTHGWRCRAWAAQTARYSCRASTPPPGLCSFGALAPRAGLRIRGWLRTSERAAAVAPAGGSSVHSRVQHVIMLSILSTPTSRAGHEWLPLGFRVEVQTLKGLAPTGITPSLGAARTAPTIPPSRALNPAASAASHLNRGRRAGTTEMMAMTTMRTNPFRSCSAGIPGR